MNTFYVYEHWRPDKDICFYVGKGTGYRGYSFKRKYNRYYDNIIKKLSQLGLCAEVRIVKGGIIEDEAFLLEIERIDFWKKAGVRLANKTNGGEGSSGYKPTKASRNKLSISRAAAHARPESKAKHSAAVKAARSCPESKEKTSRLMKEVWGRPGYKENMKRSIRIAWARPGYKDKLSAALKAAKAKPEIKKKISDAAKVGWARRKAAQAALI